MAKLSYQRIALGLTQTRLARWLAVVCLVATVSFGAWSVGRAVVAGEMGPMLAWTAGSILMGFYYLAILRIAQGRSVGFGPDPRRA